MDSSYHQMGNQQNVELIEKGTTSGNHQSAEEIYNPIQHRDITWSQIIGGSVGNILEWYDFATFGLLASEIGYCFFPSHSNHAIELLKAYGIFAGAFIMRPVGGVIFG
eukprot:326488_1